MAQRVITQLISDLSGEDIADGKGETIEFSYRGSSYSIDLTDKEAAGFDKAIAMYLEHATSASCAIEVAELLPVGKLGKLSKLLEAMKDLKKEQRASQAANSVDDLGRVLSHAV